MTLNFLSFAKDYIQFPAVIDSVFCVLVAPKVIAVVFSFTIDIRLVRKQGCIRANSRMGNGFD